MTAEDRFTPEEALAIEEADAWLEYLESTQAEMSTGRYEDIEPWAWVRLRQRLRVIERKRSRMSPAAA